MKCSNKRQIDLNIIPLLISAKVCFVAVKDSGYKSVRTNLDNCFTFERPMPFLVEIVLPICSITFSMVVSIVTVHSGIKVNCVRYSICHP